MRLVIIEIGNWLFHAIQEREEPKYSNSLGDAVRDGIPLPYNPTNGDMIKAMFPTADIATNDKLGEAGTVFVHHKDNITIFHLDWWNEPYREEKE